jgi:CheY-like chemotaxis protein
MRSRSPVLLVDDDAVDVCTLQRAFRAKGILNPLEVCEDGESALAYLKNSGPGRRPGLILLDLNMPRMGGLEFLSALKLEKGLRQIPVVVLSTSRETRDVSAAYDRGVAGYIVKPVNFGEFLEAIDILKLYWLLCENPTDVR